MPQVLTLLNGPMFYQLANRNSVLSKNLAEADGPEEKLDVIFLSIFSRRPRAWERELALAEIESGPIGVSNVIWALINTRQFMFVQ